MKSLLKSLPEYLGIRNHPDRGRQSHHFPIPEATVHTPYCLWVEPIDDRPAHLRAAEGIEIRRFPFHFGRHTRDLTAADLGGPTYYVHDRVPHVVSRNHCVILPSEDGLDVVDESSTLGTVVNGMLIGGRTEWMAMTLEEGENTLILGGPHSPYRFRLVVKRLL